MRNVRIITDSIPVSVGSFRVNQPLPTNAMRQADPFLLLHHGGLQTIEPGSSGISVPAHPHRGFEPVSFVFAGTMRHLDSLGNIGTIGPGEVQWITAGAGIMHEEGTTPELNRDGGEVEMIQLWVNLPADKKMMPPAYQELHRDVIPTLALLDDTVTLRVVAGELGGVKGPATTQSELAAAMGEMRKGGSGVVDVSGLDTLVVYVLDGEMKVNGEHRVDAGKLIAFEPGEGGFEMEVISDGKFLLLAGEPLNEPTVQHGPFVMNTEQEIRDAFRDYAGGKFGDVVSVEA